MAVGALEESGAGRGLRAYPATLTSRMQQLRVQSRKKAQDFTWLSILVTVCSRLCRIATLLITCEGSVSGGSAAVPTLTMIGQ